MPGLQKVPITIPILGLDTHSDPKAAPPGSCDLAENVYYRRGTLGGVESRKRFGTTARPRTILGGGTITNGRKIVEYGNEELLVTDTQLYSWSSIAGAWVARGWLTPAGLSSVKIASSINSSKRTLTTAAVGGGYMCAISRVGAVIRATVIDLSTGVAAQTDTDVFLGPNANGGRVIALATCFMILAMSNNGSTITAATIDYSAPWDRNAAVAVAVNASTTASRWDAVKMGSADQVGIVYNGDAANRLRGILWNANNTSAGSFLFAEQPDGSIGFLDHDYADGKAWIAYVDSARGVKTLPITISGWTAGASTSVDAGILTGRNITGFRSGGVNTLFLERADAGGAHYLDKIQRQSGAGVFIDFQLGASLRSRAFKVGSSYYLAINYDDGLQDKYFVLDVTTAALQIVATAFDGLGSGVSPIDSWLTSVPAISSTVVAVPVEVFETTVGVAGSTGDQDIYAAVYVRLDFAPTLSSPKRIGETLIFPGAIVRSYDGAATTEQGFPVFPVLYNPTQTAGIGSIAVGTYKLKAIYTFIDNKGQTHRSGESAPVEVVVAGANSQVTIDATNLRLGDKGTKASVTFYTSLDNGTTSYRATGVTASTADKTTITLFAISSGNEGEELYTTGRALAHSAFPPASLIEAWRDRAFLGQTDEPDQLWVSDEIEDGEGLAVSQANVLPLPTDDGDVTSLSEFDDRVLIGKAGALYQLSGSGPAANGDGQYQSPSRINSVSGPTSQNGVIKTTNGLIFKSSHGLYLLPRGGADPVRLLNVEGYDSLTLTGASNVDGYEQTRLVTAEGRTLVYHYGLTDERGIGRWSTSTGQAAVDCCNFAGAWCYLSSDGTVHVEVAGQYADDGVAYVRNERFNWLTGGGQFGNIRLYDVALLGEVLSSCTIAATLAYDFDATAIDSETKAVTTATKGLLAIPPSRRRLDAAQIAISETSTGEGYRLTAIGLEIGAEMGFSRKAVAAFFA